MITRDELRRLPHWARVAFAARCARLVLPLFQAAWPDASPRYKDALDRAIALAERSAAERQPADGLREAAIDACGAAGRAQVPHLFDIEKVRDSGAAPLGEDGAVVATLAAKVAEMAANAARSLPAKSSEPTGDAFYFALDTLEAAGSLGLIERLETDFEELKRTMPPEKPWWRFW
jgi:hypothetical protein